MEGCKHGGCTLSVGEAFAHDGKDIWSSIGGDAGKWWQRRLVRWKDCKMRVGPAARGQRSRVTEEMFGVAPGWGSDGVYDGKAANMEVAPAARGQRSCKHGGCTRCVGATLARDGRDVRSSIVCLCVCLCLSVCFSVCVCL